jgi:hypothetical protein
MRRAERRFRATRLKPPPIKAGVRYSKALATQGDHESRTYDHGFISSRICILKHHSRRGAFAKRSIGSHYWMREFLVEAGHADAGSSATATAASTSPSRNAMARPERAKRLQIAGRDQNGERLAQL